MLVVCLSACLASCNYSVKNARTVDIYPPLFPDYTGVTIPPNIAPMNFSCMEEGYERMDVVVKGGREGELHVNALKPCFPIDRWRELVGRNRGDSLSVSVSIRKAGEWTTYKPFSMYVSRDSIDYGVMYRKIAPGYLGYSNIQFAERNLSNFEERTLLDNTLVAGMCINCHAMNKSNPENLTFHARGSHAATVVYRNGKSEFLNTKTDSTLAHFVYPYWHPSGAYIAYSTNDTRDYFHATADERQEVYDLASDVLVYHPETHRILRSPLLERVDAFENYPVFSPDGRKLYFTTSPKHSYPDEYREVRYILCSIDFHPEDGTFGNRIDTLADARHLGKSITLPRPSYDGKYLMLTLIDYGSFSVWHKEADLWLYKVDDGTLRPMNEVNSPDTESAHNWDSSSRWFIFCSKRFDGFYTRLYIARMDEEGNISKPFLLPQEDPWSFYNDGVYSYSLPDFTDAPIRFSHRSMGEGIRSDKRTQVELH
ncbi:MAG: PD40 domain-containing protein [Bacteroides sp.]|nr:PD40 domain-containing protein [Bacteroides sp.]